MLAKLFNKQKGVGLIEVLVATAVVAVGMTAVVTLQGNLTAESTDNKARAEAIALAQQHIESLKNYTQGVGTKAEFDTEFADTDGYEDVDTITGKLASFNRDQQLDNVGGMVRVDVKVSWQDARDETQHVVVSSDIGWQQPRGPADLEMNVSDPIVEAPTGAARIIGETVALDTGSPNTDTNDGTRLWQDGDNLKLVVGTNAVLLLEDACKTPPCQNFVTIQGKVYMHKDTNRSPSEIFVKASDAAYCHRYYVPSGQTTGVALTSVNENSIDSTANGDYDWFNYTCYLGGGWYGNIGIIMANGLGPSDAVCMGDPTYDADTEPYQAPTLGTRRAYRGMMYRIDTSNTTGLNAGKELDQDGKPKYFEVGVRDAIAMPVTVDDGNGVQVPLYGHDFVVTRITGQGGDCVSEGVLTEADSNMGGTAGDLFEDNLGDFVCLNLHGRYDNGFESEGIYAINPTCPYDPADPPADYYTVQGLVTVTGDETIRDVVSQYSVETSNGLGNCEEVSARIDNLDGGGTYVIDYECGYYVWRDVDNNAIGWDGKVYVSGLQTDVTCGNWTAVNESRNVVKPEANITCEMNDASAGLQVIVQGTVTLSNSRKFFSQGDITLSGTTSVTCQVSGVDGLSQRYTCDTDVLTDVTEWDGAINFSASGTKICSDNPDVNDGSSSVSIGIYTAQNAQITHNISLDNNCN